MEPPKPKRMIIASIASNPRNNPNILILTACEQAAQWIESYGPQVGILRKPPEQPDGIICDFRLHVWPNFDADEVCAYINSMADLFR